MKALANYRGAVDIVPFVGSHQIPPQGRPPKHAAGPVQIDSDIWIGPLGDLKKSVIEASVPPGENWHVHRTYRCQYALWRTDPPTKPVNGIWWDSDQRLHRCIQQLRLVRPTTLAYQYACRLAFDSSGKRVIRPAGVVGQGALAYLSAGYPDGVQDRDIVQLRKLLHAFKAAELPNRVKNALWMHEHVAWTRLMNIRWPLVVTALEALIHTIDRGRSRILGSTEQFCQRLEKLQDLIKECLWSADDLSAIYDLRSSFAHGRGGEVDALNGEPLRLYEVAQCGLATILRSCILKQAVADIFRTDSSIRTALHF